MKINLIKYTKNVLPKFKSLDFYTYSYKFPVEIDDDIDTIKRKYRKMKKIQLSAMKQDLIKFSKKFNGDYIYEDTDEIKKMFPNNMYEQNKKILNQENEIMRNETWHGIINDQ